MTPVFRRAASPLARLLFTFSILLAGSDVASARADTLGGRVLDPDGRPVPNTTVVVDGPLGARTIAVEADGTFTAPRDPRTTYRLVAKAPGFIADPITVRDLDPAQHLTITLRVAPVSEAVVVLASQVPRPLSESPASSTVIARDEIEARQIETVADALRTTAGFTVARSGGRGALTSVFPRGGESDYTLVFVDGMEVNAFGGGFDFSLLPFGDVAQVETVRGPQSALFGSNAIGGIVEVTTRHGGPATGSVMAEGGSQQLFHTRAGGAASRGDWSFGGGIEHFTSQGFTGTAPASGETVSNDDWRQSTASGSVSWSRNATLVRGTGRWLDADRGNPGPYGSNPIGAFPGVNRVARGGDTEKQGAVAGHLPWSQALSGRVQQDFDVTYADLENRFHDTFGDSTFSTRRSTFRTRTDVALAPATGVSAGIEYVGERARSTYVLGEQNQQVPIERQQLGVFGELRHDLGARATLTAGVRIERIGRSALEGNVGDFSSRPAFPEDVVTSTNPRIAGVVALWRDARGTVRTRLHASFGTGIRPPDAFEIAFTDNPSLKPERSRSVDAGVSHLVSERFSVDATYFYNRYDDLIVAVGSFTDVSRFKTDNISNARAEGLELSASWRGPHGIVAHGAYTFLPTEVLAVDGTTDAPPPFTVGDPLIRRPRHQGSLNVLWTSGPVTAFAEARARGTELDVEPNYGTFGGLFTGAGYVVVDAGGGWRIRSRIEVYGRAMNLLDRSYEEVYGYPALGRTAVGGLRLAVGH